jgi:hypothetical protein
MIRKILFLGALGAASLTLAGCGPSSGILATAKTGDCFNVTGKDAMGQPKLIHSDCPAGQTSGQSTLPPPSGDQTAAAPAAPAADARAAAATTTPPPGAQPVKADAKAVCQPVAPTCVVPAKAHAARAPAYHAKAASHVSATVYTHALNTRRVWRTRHVIRHRHGHAYSETVTEYVPASGEVVATIGAPYTATTELSGGSHEDTYVLRDHPVYVPPPPPAYGPPPPPPPPPADARRYDDRRGYGSRSYSSQSYSSQSYSSSGAGQRRALPPPPPPPPCNCTVRHAPAYEPDGYLTWPNKTEY